MNRTIEQIFTGFSVGGVSIPVKYMYYQGHGEPYVTYMHQSYDNELRGDDALIGVADYYDFDVYAKGNFEQIILKVKELLEASGWVWIPSRSGIDMYETDTHYYHKTLCFMILKEG